MVDPFQAVLGYTVIACLLTALVWRHDIFFAVFFSMIALYSVMPQWAYLLYPELSDVILNMYFGTEPFVEASIFSLASLFCLYLGYWLIYRPLIKRTYQLPAIRPKPFLLVMLLGVYLAGMAIGYLSFRDNLSYSNASDEWFISSVGLGYRTFVHFFKLLPPILLTIYVLLRCGAVTVRWRLWLLALGLGLFAAFVLIASATGNRTDPLALMLGVLGFEIYQAHLALHPGRKGVRGFKWLAVRKIMIGALLLTIITVTLLTVLENTRSDDGGTAVEGKKLSEVLLVKDYYPPFHVLIGAIANDYVDPLTVLGSNAANSLMFMNVPYLQFYVVDQWAPGTVTRSASPALFVFTEGYVFAGWLGILYNGVFLSLGLALWRRLSRTSDEWLNALFFALAVALAATVARSQLSYFLKDLYIVFLPPVVLFVLASGMNTRIKVGVSPCGVGGSPRVQLVRWTI